MKQGLFILLEGTDGSGKTTQTKLLVDRLAKEGYPVEQMSFPQYGKPSAAMVEAYLRGDFGSTETVGPYRASIFFAVDRYAASAQIRHWLDAGNIVIANRYVASNMAHQGGQIADMEKRAAYLEWEYHLEYTLFGIPKPDINIILHMPADISKRLIDARTKAGTHDHTDVRDIHEEDVEHLKRAEAAYLDIVRTFPEYSIIECVADGNILPPLAIHEHVWSLIRPRLIS